MTSLAEALRVRLLDDAAVKALVGDRVHWAKRDQGGDLPAIVLRRISGQHPDHLDGAEDMATSRIQIDCLAERYLASEALAAAARAALQGEAQVGTMLFWRASFDGPRDLGEATETGFVHRQVLDMMCRHTSGN